jgi:penicillin-binding protein A
MISNDSKTTWREYQERLHRENRQKDFWRRLPRRLAYGGAWLLVLIFVCLIGGWISALKTQAGTPSPEAGLKKGHESAQYPGEKSQQVLLKDLNPDLGRLRVRMDLRKGPDRFIVTSSLDPALQEYVTRLLRRSLTRMAAVVVLDSRDGRVLALASYDMNGVREDLCLQADFPAASLIKIISAAAAMESAGFSPDQDVYFSGGKYTLYRSQLTNKTHKYSSKVPFKKAFGASINPVFGKIGVHYLGQNVMTHYAERFYFNQIIPFDLPVSMSTIRVRADDYGVAEATSGFDKKTHISPLHAALLASVAANDGVMVAPWLVEKIQRDSGEVIYQKGRAVMTPSVKSGTAKRLKILMHETVTSGTCSRAFRPLRQKKAFRTVDLGAKTGTLNDETNRYLIDWLSSFALARNGEKSICVAVLGVHGKKIGIRANVLGRHIIDYYFTS